MEGTPKSEKAAGQGRRGDSVRMLLNTKVSPSGTSDALFQECLDTIRQRRAALKDEQEPLRGDIESPIKQLTADELEITRQIFSRVDPMNKLTSNYSHGGHDIDPYWNPFSKVADLKDQVTAEFDEYARFVSVAEAKRVRVMVKRQLRKAAAVYNPYSPEAARHYQWKVAEGPPKPFHLHERHWERTPLQERLGRERITWRDVDIIRHFLADNGNILPRRTTKLTRRQQDKLVTAVRTAQRMALIPYDWKSPDYQCMPLVDPMQFVADRLTDRVIEHRDQRSKAMLRVMIERHPELNYKKFLKHEAARAAGQSSAGPPPYEDPEVQRKREREVPLSNEDVHNTTPFLRRPM